MSYEEALQAAVAAAAKRIRRNEEWVAAWRAHEPDMNTVQDRLFAAQEAEQASLIALAARLPSRDRAEARNLVKQALVASPPTRPERNREIRRGLDEATQQRTAKALTFVQDATTRFTTAVLFNEENIRKRCAGFGKENMDVVNEIYRRAHRQRRRVTEAIRQNAPAAKFTPIYEEHVALEREFALKIDKLCPEETPAWWTTTYRYLGTALPLGSMKSLRESALIDRTWFAPGGRVIRRVAYDMLALAKIALKSAMNVIVGTLQRALPVSWANTLFSLTSAVSQAYVRMITYSVALSITILAFALPLGLVGSAWLFQMDMGYIEYIIKYIDIIEVLKNPYYMAVFVGGIFAARKKLGMKDFEHVDFWKTLLLILLVMISNNYVPFVRHVKRRTYRADAPIRRLPAILSAWADIRGYFALSERTRHELTVPYLDEALHPDNSVNEVFLEKWRSEVHDPELLSETPSFYMDTLDDVSIDLIAQTLDNAVVGESGLVVAGDIIHATQGRNIPPIPVPGSFNRLTDAIIALELSESLFSTTHIYVTEIIPLFIEIEIEDMRTRISYLPPMPTIDDIEEVNVRVATKAAIIGIVSLLGFGGPALGAGILFFASELKTYNIPLIDATAVTTIDQSAPNLDFLHEDFATSSRRIRSRRPHS